MTKESEMVERENLADWLEGITASDSFVWTPSALIKLDAITAFLRAPALVLSERDAVSLEIVLSAAEAYVMQVGYRNVGRTTEAIEALQSLRSQAPAQGVEEAHEAECHGQGHEFKDGACMFCGFAPQPPPPVEVDQLAQIIRKVDGNHSLGAGALAEAILREASLPPVASEGPVLSEKEREVIDVGAAALEQFPTCRPGEHERNLLDAATLRAIASRGKL
jgi:hypothetical protein